MNKTYFDVLTEHSAAYPDMRPEDYLKLAYQSEFGCGHLLTDRDTAYEMLLTELNKVGSDTLEPMTVDIGGGYSRLNLSAVKRYLPPEIIFSLFEKSCGKTGTEEGFRNKLSLAVRSARLGIIKADAEALESCFAAFDMKTIPSHSTLFRNKYRAAYRVIKSDYAPLIPALALIIDAAKSSELVNVAIDGGAATGKTTLAECLAQILGADVIHMDDFFLPESRKTPERLSVAGGNIDSERFSREVAEHINDAEITYGKFDCKTQRITETVTLNRTKILIVEGVYSLHPEYTDIYNVKIFTESDPVSRRERLIRRGGEALFERYYGEWIPLEERYFIECEPASSCDLRIRT